MQIDNKRICGRCGSSNLISDRSLGGKFVCVKCGSSFIKKRGLLSSINRNFYYILLIFLVIFLVVLI